MDIFKKEEKGKTGGRYFTEMKNESFSKKKKQKNNMY